MHFRNYIHFILRVNLYELIDTLDQNKAQYVVNPLKDFKRKRKLDFKRLIRLMLTMGSRTISGEIENDFCETSIDPDRPSASAFVQQRAKIKHEAFEFLFREFVLSLSATAQRQISFEIRMTLIHLSSIVQKAIIRYI